MALPNPYAGSYTDAPTVPRWGLGDAFVGWLISFVAAALFGSLVVVVSGYADNPEDLPLGLTALGNVPLWIGFVAVPIWAAATKGNGWIRDFHVAIRGSDVALGIVAGLLAQVVLVRAFTWVTVQFTSYTVEDVERPARELADKAQGLSGTLLFILIVVVLAPLAEELFFRGLLLRSFEKRFGQWWALAGSSLIFGATHFEPLQFLALSAVGALFGYLVVRTGRLGPAIVAHMAFNGTAVVGLLWMS